jgi:hypothetical protein
MHRDCEPLRLLRDAVRGEVCIRERPRHTEDELTVEDLKTISLD